MSIDPAGILHLLHETAFGCLATHSVQAPGYPFASVLPFAPDECHRPVFLISRLAEHTSNLLADGRASLLVHRHAERGVLAEERATLLGEVEQVQPSPELTARYLRYQPDARRYLALGDFAFFRLLPRRVRYIGGFGRMGWSEASEWSSLSILSPQAEATLLERLATAAAAPAQMRLLGLDCYGFDIENAGTRRRHRFPDAPLNGDNLEAAARRCLLAP